MAVGWRQFDSTNSNFRQSGYAYTTNGGLDWTFPGKVDAGTFRSDPVLASDAEGVFYFIGITNTSLFSCDLARSDDGGATWTRVGGALGGDKEWMAIDTSLSPGRGNLYQVWSPMVNVYNNPNQIFSRSTDGGASWMPAMDLPQQPYWGTVAVGPNGEVYVFGAGTSVDSLWLDRSTDATNRLAAPTIDLSTAVDLGGSVMYGVAGINPDGLLGQAWVAVDCSTNATRGNVYVLCSVTNDPGNIANVMFRRSTDGGVTWGAPVRINDDPATQNAAHWFGTLAVAPNGRVDACWNDTRNSPDNSTSQLYYSWSEDGGLTWAANRPLSPPFNQSLGYPQQNKLGDYIAMVSLDSGACIAYTATFNGEQDIYFVRAELPIATQVQLTDGTLRLSWNGVPGVQYCVESVPDLTLGWNAAGSVGCLVATNTSPFVDVPITAAAMHGFYRVVRQAL